MAPSRSTHQSHPSPTSKVWFLVHCRFPAPPELPPGFSLSYDLTSSSSPLLSLSLFFLSPSLSPSLFPSRLILPLPPHFPLVSLFFSFSSPNPFYNILIVEVVLSAFPLVHYSRYRPPLDFRIPFQYSFALARPWPSAPFQF